MTSAPVRLEKKSHMCEYEIYPRKKGLYLPWIFLFFLTMLHDWSQLIYVTNQWQHFLVFYAKISLSTLQNLIQNVTKKIQETNRHFFPHFYEGLKNEQFRGKDKSLLLGRGKGKKPTYITTFFIRRSQEMALNLCSAEAARAAGAAKHCHPDPSPCRHEKREKEWKRKRERLVIRVFFWSCLYSIFRAKRPSTETATTLLQIPKPFVHPGSRRNSSSSSSASPTHASQLAECFCCSCKEAVSTTTHRRLVFFYPVHQNAHGS